MEYGKIISVTGMSGLFELVGSKKDGAIVKSLEDKSTKFVSSRIHNFSHLESIEVYTVGDNVNLVELLQAMDASGKDLPDQKDPAAVKAYFQEVYPDMDLERVYASDMKKMVKWYSVLKDNNVEFKLSEVDEEQESEEAAEDDTEPVSPVGEEKKPAPKDASKKSETQPADEKEKTPKVSTAAKEKTETKEADKLEEKSEEKEAAAPKKRAPRKKKTEE